jgi:hypothetical protein
MRTILSTWYPTFTDIWTHHLLPFLLPSERYARSWLYEVVMRQLLMIDEHRKHMDGHLLDVSSNSRHVYVNTTHLVIEIWCWRKRHTSYMWYGFNVNRDGLQMYDKLSLTPALLEDIDMSRSFGRCGVCSQYQYGSFGRSFLLKGTSIKFLTCEDHLLIQGVIYKKDGMYYEARFTSRRA